MKHLVNRLFAYRPLRWLIITLGAAASAAYLILFVIVGLHAHDLLKHPRTPRSDAALVLGNRAYLDGALNPCLTGRVDEGLLLAQQGLVATLAMTGGRDHEDNSVEAEVMAAYAKNKGYNGPILLESRSSSTQENLEFSAPILKAANIKSVIIVSEPYHLWRAEKLVAAGHLGHDFNVSYAAAPSQCWATWDMLFKGALREPLAIMNNYAKGYFKQN
ncbi:MAG: YdcF family protein [Methylotenera sp.]